MNGKMKFFALFLSLFALINPSSLLAATGQRIALVIGNSAYSFGPLKTTVNDATDMAEILKKLGFTVTLKRNARLHEMDEAIEEFGNKLKRGGVGLFYYAGHSVQVDGTNYVLPIGAKINKEADVKHQAVDVNKILDEMATANNGLNIVILDACRDNPYSRNFRDAARGLAIVSEAPVGTYISYSTDANNVVRDGEGRNSPYMEALAKYMKEPGLTIEQVFKKVRAKLGKETGGKQIPWELSSLQGEFYFAPGSSKSVMDRDETTMAPAMGKLPSASTANELGRDGRFIAYDNGTVLDTQTKLMWAARDNGSNIDWEGAKRYCENYRGGGYKNWRMPTLNELEGLYDRGKIYNTACGYAAHLTELIVLTCPWPWTSETRGSDAAGFHFGNGEWHWIRQSIDNISRALPVRSGK